MKQTSWDKSSGLSPWGLAVYSPPCEPTARRRRHRVDLWLLKRQTDMVAAMMRTLYQSAVTNRNLSVKVKLLITFPTLTHGHELGKNEIADGRNELPPKGGCTLPEMGEEFGHSGASWGGLCF